MKKPTRNHQEANFNAKAVKPRGDNPVWAFLRPIVFFGIVGYGLYYCYASVYNPWRIRETVRTLMELRDSVRTISGSNYANMANPEMLMYKGHIAESDYDEKNKMIKNRYGGFFSVQPYASGMSFRIEVSGIPPETCRAILAEYWGDGTALDSIRLFGKNYDWSPDNPYKLPIPPADIETGCNNREVGFVFK